MNFNQLLIFHKVAEKGHFTRAAEELFISQPAVSRQVHELERSLGQPLFTQMGRKLYLTEAGELLYDYASRILALADEAEHALSELQHLERGRLAVASSTTIGTYLLPEIFGRYHERYPHVELLLGIANAEEVQRRLVNHQVEIGLIEGKVTHSELDKRVWRQDELVLIASAQHALVRKNHRWRLQEILDEGIPFILREHGSGTRDVLDEAIAARGLEPIQPIMQFGSTEAVKRAVAAGLGVSFVSEQTIQLELTAGLLKRVDLDDFRLTRPFYIIYPKQKRLSKAVQAFLSMIET